MTKILIVDDNQIIRTVLSSTLQTNGYDTVTAKNGLEGVTSALENMPDLILMDIMMPVKDGYQAIQQIKADPSTNHIPIVVISADSNSFMQSKTVGADACLKKPWNVDALLDQIQLLLNQLSSE